MIGIVEKAAALDHHPQAIDIRIGNNLGANHVLQNFSRDRHCRDRASRDGFAIIAKAPTPRSSRNNCDMKKPRRSGAVVRKEICTKRAGARHSVWGRWYRAAETA